MARPGERAGLDPLPDAPIGRLTAPLRRFLHVEAASGIVLLAFTAAALVLANSPLAEGFLSFWKTPVEIGFGPLRMSHSLKHWINDGLMAVFFFVIGLEVKRELVLGELRDLRRAALPVVAALGGMLVPAALYLALQRGESGEAGWGIPMATDIAFVVGCLAVLGSRVPPSLRITLLSLAIIDDIGAILVIAVGYTEAIHGTALALGVLGIGVVVGLARLGVRSVGVYILVGASIWLAFHESGVHATIAGVILGLLTPAHSLVSPGWLARTVQRAGKFLHGDGERERAPHDVVRQLEAAVREGISPLERLEHRLHPWVGFGIMPLFAFANAGVVLDVSAFGHPVALAVALGLVVGKPLGILGFSALAVRLGLARLPEGIGWSVLCAGGFLAGIGFTMALFIAGLALEGPLLQPAKLGVLVASVIAALVGMALLSRLLPPRAPGASPLSP